MQSCRSTAPTTGCSNCERVKPVERVSFLAFGDLRPSVSLHFNWRGLPTARTRLIQSVSRNFSTSNYDNQTDIAVQVTGVFLYLKSGMQKKADMQTTDKILKSSMKHTLSFQNELFWIQFGHMYIPFISRDLLFFLKSAAGKWQSNERPPFDFQLVVFLFKLFTHGGARRNRNVSAKYYHCII